MPRAFRRKSPLRCISISMSRRWCFDEQPTFRSRSRSRSKLLLNSLLKCSKSKLKLRRCRLAAVRHSHLSHSRNNRWNRNNKWRLNLRLKSQHNRSKHLKHCYRNPLSQSSNSRSHSQPQSRSDLNWNASRLSISQRWSR